jgi:hypothetical protein
MGMDNPNRFEPWGTWLGTEPIIVALNAPRGRHLALAFAAAPGPSRPGTDRRTLVLASGPHEIGRVEIDGPARVVFPFVTAGGRETLSLSTPDTPTRARMPNGDLRPLLVKIENLRIEPGDPGS